ncbi:MAG: DNA (cytosine-5-)-methyltransferase [Thiothrix sp.]
MSNGFTFIDLFAGIGGFRLALDHLGGKCLNFSEIHSDAINTYCTNFREDGGLNLGDITKVKRLPAHDILTAGVPCQSWSIAGKNLGFDDDRGQLWNDTIYLLNQSRPKAFIFENVKGLADPRNQSALAYILARIRQAGYFAKHFVLNSSDYGVPQDRIRCISSVSCTNPPAQIQPASPPQKYPETGRCAARWHRQTAQRTGKRYHRPVRQTGGRQAPLPQAQRHE